MIQVNRIYLIFNRLVTKKFLVDTSERDNKKYRVLTIKFMNMRTITFNELRKIKDSLPSGSMHRIADELGLNVDTVRNFFGGHNFKEGKSVGIHLEPGPDGGLVMIDDTTVLERALKILDEMAGKTEEAVRA